MPRSGRLRLALLVALLAALPATTFADGVAAGVRHALQLRPDGTVVAWGSNVYGQLGDGTFSERPTSVAVTGLTDVTTVAAGAFHSLAVTGSGTLLAWGSNTSAQLGFGSAGSAVNTPQVVTGLSGVVGVAAGWAHSVALTRDGAVWTWGANADGQLGDGTTTLRSTPTRVSALDGVTIVAVAASAFHTLALAADGTVYAWGRNTTGQLGDGSTTPRLSPVAVSGLTGVTALAAGERHSLALKGNGTVWAWGDNASAQLGDGTTLRRTSPVQVGTIPAAVAIAAGGAHSIALAADGHVCTWGRNAYEELGDGTTTPRLTPATVPGATDVVTIGAGVYQTLAVTDGGAFFTWGGYPGGTATSTIVAGYQHGFWLRRAGSVVGWGGNTYGQVGDGSSTTRLSPVAVSGLAGVTAVAVGGYHGLAVTTDGRLLAWGNSSYSQLGLDPGLPPPFNVPTEVAALTRVVAVTGGTYHSVALTADGAVWTWGYNGYGQLGDGTTTLRSQPIRVTALDGVSIVAVAAGEFHTLALTAGGTVYAWGRNNEGEIGDGSTTTRMVPTLVPGLSAVTGIAAGQYHSLARRSDGTAWAWGDNSAAQLGDGTYTRRTSPVQVGVIPAAVTLAASGAHSVALDADGGVWTWGRNVYGELGDGTTTARLNPALVVGPTDVVAIGAGWYHTVVVTASDEIWTWGSNTFGQLGDGSQDSRPAPLAIGGEDGTWIVGAPQLSPGAGAYTEERLVTLTSATPGATIRYTTDGTTPDAQSPSVPSGGVVSVTQSLTLKAVAVKFGQPDSLLKTATYTLRVATPTLSPTAGMYPPGQAVTVTGAGTGVTLRVTVDGSEPTTGSPLFTGSLPLSATTTVKAKGFKDGWDASTTVSGVYTINAGMLAGPTASPTGGLYTTDQTVTLSGPAGATLRYTTNGSTPAPSSPAYTAPLVLAATTTLKAMAFETGWVSSPVMTEVYTFKVATPVPSLPAGAYAPGQVVMLASPTPDATIHYTLNGATPTATDPVLAPGAALPLGNFTLSAVGFKTGSTASDVVTVAYTLTDPLTAGVVAAGSLQSLALRRDGTVWSWGGNSSGQLGDGTTTGRTVPVMVHGLTGVLRSLSAGQSHGLAVRTDGTVWAWGANAYGKLGDGTTTQRPLPIQVPGLTDIVAVAAGESHSLALTAQGSVWAWGYNGNGQLGDGTTTARASPVPVTGLVNIVAIAAGGSHSLAVDAAGQVWAWGANTFGQLGDGTTTGRLVPTAVVSLTDVVQVAAGRYHSVARTGTGTVFTWGYNGYGELGDGTTTTRQTPVSVGSLADATWVAAGQYTSFAVTRAGALWAWGANANAQLGDRTTTQRTAPVLVAGLPPVATVAAGDVHGVALTTEDAVWSWGLNTYGQLGDGSTVAETHPVPVGGPDFTWGVVLPAFAPPAGTYAAVQVVAITTPTPGAVIHYTTNGVEPTEGDPVLEAGATVPVDHALTLLARAWKTGVEPSGVATASYVLQAAAPTATPGTGVYPSARSVTLASATPDAAIRYTLDGTVPDGNSPLYAAPLPIVTGTVLTARAFRTDWAASDATVAVYTFDYGTLAPPVASPPGGTYSEPQLVTLTAAPGATIRYTLDGSQPTEASGVYTTPLTVSTTMTLQARAFLVDWTPSLSAVEIYTLANDATPPTITATLSPAANEAGWHHSDVTVTFTCDDPDSGITVCPSPVTVTTEGAGQVVERMATNGAGLTATTSVTINLDKTPPAVTLTAPEDGATVVGPTTAAAGTATDALSGLASVRCNGQAASVDGDVVTCAAPVRAGRNAIIVHATDVAGNSGSAGATVSVAGSGLAVFPSRFTLLQGESRTLVATDDAGVPVDGVTWTTSDPSVAAFSVDDPSRLEALGPGDATVTATLDSLTATAQVTVVAGATLPMGTVVWAADPLAGVTAGGIVYTHRTDPTVPDLYGIESMGWPQWTRYRGFGGDGSALPVQVPPLGDDEYVDQTMGDTSGGVAVRFGGGVVRFAGPAGVPPWRYDAAGSVGDMAQGPDGTIYLVEWENGYLEVVVLDGDTGLVRQRIGLPRSTSVTWNWDCEPNRTVSSESPADIGPLSVGAQGTGYLELATTEEFYDYMPCGAGGGESTHRLHLLSVNPDGTLTLQLLRSETSYTDSFTMVTPQQALPDGNGGVLASWAIDYPDHGETLGVYVRDGGVTEYTLPGTAWTEGTDADHYTVDLVGDDGVGYMGGDSQLAFDMATGATRWTVAVPGLPLLALAEGHVAVQDEATGILTLHDSSGIQDSSSPMPVVSPTTSLALGLWHGVAMTGDIPIAVAGPDVNESLFSFQTGPGDAQDAKAPPRPYKDMDRAAVLVLQRYNLKSIKENSEYGGQVCEDSAGLFFATNPARNPIFSDYIEPTTCPPWGSFVGQYHTHGNIGDDGFSGGDIVNADRPENQGKAWYVATPCGHIDKYVGPNFAVYWRLADKTSTPIKCVQ